MSLKQIAQMTGVSVSTVGRILNDPDHKCSSTDVRRRVIEAARKINYIPNANARSLRIGSRSIDDVFRVNILLARSAGKSADPFFDELLMLVEKELRNSGCIIGNVWHCAEFSDEKQYQPNILEKLTENMYPDNAHKSDGLIIIGRVSRRALKLIRGHEKNIIAVDRSSSGLDIDEVICDGEKNARDAAAYLVKLGHTRIGYVGSCHGEPRFDGYRAALSEHHIPSDIDFIYDTVPDEEHGYTSMEYFMSLDEPPTAVYCANDIIALGMIKYCNKFKVKSNMPSIISGDNIDAAQYTKPMLTAVSLPKAEMVRFVLMLLLDRIKGGHRTAARVVLDGTLVIRESCRRFTEMSEPEYYI